MPTHYIMLSFQDFGTSRDAYRDYLNQKALAAGGAYTVATFEELADNLGMSRVKFAIRKAQGNKLKLLLHGHGDGVHDSISNDGSTASKSADELTTLVRTLLQGRAATAATAPSTAVIMLSCLYGRAQGGDLKRSNAWALHRKLQAAGVYVELVARTELVVQSGTGIQQSTHLRHLMNQAASGARKLPFGKVRCFYGGAAYTPELELVDSIGAASVASTSTAAARQVWALSTIGALLSHANNPSQKANHREIHNALVAYDTVQDLRVSHDHDPPFLKQILEYLSGRSATVPLPAGYGATPVFVSSRLTQIKHRSIGFFGYHSAEPLTTQELVRLLGTYP
jgi:hypothetical protein